MTAQYDTAASLDGFIAAEDDSLDRVFSTRALPAAPGADIRFVRGDARPVHAAMR